jgi:hypothetical protein
MGLRGFCDEGGDVIGSVIVCLALCAAEHSAPADAEIIIVGIEGCQPCKTMWTVVTRVAPGIRKSGRECWGYYLSADKPGNEAYFRYYGITGPYPQVLIFRRGKLAGRFVGAMSDEALGNVVR